MSRKKRLNIESHVKHRPKKFQAEKKSVAETEDEVVLPVGERTPWQINPEVTRRKAKELYLLYGYTKEMLIEATGVPEATLNHWLYNPTQGTLSWKMEKDTFKSTVLAKMKDVRGDTIAELIGRGTSILARGLADIDLSGEILSIAQLEKLNNMLTKMDTVFRLEEGKPTSIRQDLNLTQKEIEGLLEELEGLDPLMDYSNKDKVN